MNGYDRNYSVNSTSEGIVKIIMFHNISEICLFIHNSTEFPLGILDPPCRSERTILLVVWTSNGFTILALGGERDVGEGVIVSSQF